MKVDYTTMELHQGNERLLMSRFLFKILLSQRERVVWLWVLSLYPKNLSGATFWVAGAPNLQSSLKSSCSLGVVVGYCGDGASTGCKDVTKLKLWFNQEKLNYQRSPEIIWLCNSHEPAWLPMYYWAEKIKSNKVLDNFIFFRNL